jgi:hypothetical protein
MLLVYIIITYKINYCSIQNGLNRTYSKLYADFIIQYGKTTWRLTYIMDFLTCLAFQKYLNYLIKCNSFGKVPEPKICAIQQICIIVHKYYALKILGEILS